MQQAGDIAQGASGPAPDDLAWPRHSILIVDDEEGMRSFLERALAPRCAHVESAVDVETARARMERRHFDLLILDIALPGKSGIEWLRELREAGVGVDVILITAFADLESAIDALRGGASDFILKPFRIDQILNAIKNCFQRARLARENYVLRRELSERDDASGDGLVGESEAMRSLREILHRVAATPSTVLLQGESGTGKEVVARALHRLSDRAARAFVPVNCAAIPSELIESELFGHVKGAFTGAAASRNGLFYYANGGTLFLDEISELPLSMQSRLLRVLEERRLRPVGSERELPVDVRIIAASNRDLLQAVRDGVFREDLYFRLAVVDLAVPPLRERADDVPALVAHFVAQLAGRLGVQPLAVPSEVMGALCAYHWPGNVRELRNFVERSLILGGFSTASLVAQPRAARTADPELSLEEVERRHILGALEACGGNKTEAARRLGVSRKTLERKCAEWDQETA
ncbi:sigma-54-dependent transcriptional regulator [Pseudazoarcus pumilus]|uniref:Sigma-54-dependent Fis family transcriptional regulator n=1 Tax=Pseudazoarcus pumilus TaxID=2067960 RepID=A0A2I6SAD4_9RHOO|nr:sigma-54 dependent transcriptional regulator [Pseudazoarcus pumilus]AUN96228.1 sigma-54-dependent Fis family transcriptional regulator [Pseudazoarcus pumilus]